MRQTRLASRRALARPLGRRGALTHIRRVRCRPKRRVRSFRLRRRARRPRRRRPRGPRRGRSAGAYEFLGLPYAAPPTGSLRWRRRSLPRPWAGIRRRDAVRAQLPAAGSPFVPPGPFSEDCLYLNVYTPTLRRDADRPVFVWIHGGGFTEDGARNYDGSKLAADGTVVVTINYRLGALGFLAHPRSRGGPVARPATTA